MQERIKRIVTREETRVICISFVLYEHDGGDSTWVQQECKATIRCSRSMNATRIARAVALAHPLLSSPLLFFHSGRHTANICVSCSSSAYHAIQRVRLCHSICRNDEQCLYQHIGDPHQALQRQQTHEHHATSVRQLSTAFGVPVQVSWSHSGAACVNAAVYSCYLSHLCSFWPETMRFVLAMETDCWCPHCVPSKSTSSLAQVSDGRTNRSPSCMRLNRQYGSAKDNGHHRRMRH